MSLALAVLLCFVSGYFIASLGLPTYESRGRSRSAELVLRSSLAIGFGLGLFSVVYFLSLLFAPTHLVAIDIAVTAFLLAEFLLFRNRRASSSATQPAHDNSHLPQWLDRLLSASFLITSLAAIYAAVLRTLAHPHGDGWDAFAIWNLHARFLFLGGSHWRDMFSSQIPWSHPDYPLLLPAAIAHFWTYFGQDSTVIPAAIALAFTFSTVGLLCSALRLLRGRIPARLAGLALCATPAFIEQGISQYADIPLSFFFLAAIAMLALHDRTRSAPETQSPRGPLILAGIACSFAAWTKNEGLLFLVALITARALDLVLSDRALTCDHSGRLSPPKGHPRNWLNFAALLASVAPALLLIVCFKHFLAPPGDLLTDRAAALHKLLSPARYWIILQWYAKESLRFGGWLAIPGPLLLAALYWVLRTRNSDRPSIPIRASVITLSFILAGYFAIYLITPYDLYWHLRFSLNRLFLQLWPSVLFLLFLTWPWAHSETEST
jgi:hypothetical protein